MFVCYFWVEFDKLNPPGEVSTRSSSPPSIDGSAHGLEYPSTHADHLHHGQSSGSSLNVTAESDNGSGGGRDGEDADDDDDEVTQEDELILEGIIGGVGGGLTDNDVIASHFSTDINMTPVVG